MSAITARNEFKLQKGAEAGRNVYTVTFPKVNGRGSMKVVLKDNVKSRYCKYKDGVSYVGNSKVGNIPLQVFQKVGLTTAQAKALKTVSSHEGNLDSVNSYDKAIFSWGFIQFAGGAGGSLGPLMVNIKKASPKVFHLMFGKYGIDVRQAGNKGIIRVMRTNGTWAEGDAGWTEIKNDKRLTAAFIRAGYHPTIIVKQIEQSAKGYAIPALKKIKVNLNVGGQQIVVNPITTIMKSEAASTSLIDLTVNQWIVKTGNYYKTAIEKVAARQGLRTLAQLKNIDERQVLMQIVTDATDPRVKKRTKSVLDSGASFSKA